MLRWIAAGFSTLHKRARPFASHALSLLLMRFVHGAASIVSTYFVVRALTTDDFGDYQFILSLVAILAILSVNGMDNAVMQSVARGFPGTIRLTLPITFLASFSASLVLAGLGVWFLADNKMHMATGLFLAAALFPFMHGLTAWKAYRMGREQFRSYATLESATVLAIHTLIITGAIWQPGEYVWALAALMGITSLINLTFTLQLLRTVRADAPRERGVLYYGFMTTLYSIATVVASHLDKILMYLFLSPTSLALYIAAEKSVEILRNILQDVSVVLAPRFSNVAGYTKSLHQGLRLFSSIFSAAIIVAAFTLMPWLTVIIFGDAYREAIPYAQALTCILAFGNLATLQFRFIRSRLDETSFRFITLTVGAVQIVATCVLVPLLGLIGAVASTFVYRLVFSLTVRHMLSKHYRSVSLSKVDGT